MKYLNTRYLWFHVMQLIIVKILFQHFERTKKHLILTVITAILPPHWYSKKEIILNCILTNSWKHKTGRLLQRTIEGPKVQLIFFLSVSHLGLLFQPFKWEVIENVSIQNNFFLAVVVLWSLQKYLCKSDLCFCYFKVKISPNPNFVAANLTFRRNFFSNKWK